MPKATSGPNKHHEDTGVPDAWFKKGAGLALKHFIENIPANKLKAISQLAGNVHEDVNFRLDMQGMIAGDPKRHNLQVQINRNCTVTSVKKYRGSVATISIPADGSLSSVQIKTELVNSLKDEFRRSKEDVQPSSSKLSGKGRR